MRVMIWTAKVALDKGLYDSFDIKYDEDLRNPYSPGFHFLFK